MCARWYSWPGWTPAARQMCIRDRTKVINLSSNIAALVTFIATGNVCYPLGLSAGVCSIAGHYIGAGMVAHDGQKVVRFVVLMVLGVLFIKIVSGA